MKRRGALTGFAFGVFMIFTMMLSLPALAIGPQTPADFAAIADMDAAAKADARLSDSGAWFTTLGDDGHFTHRGQFYFWLVDESACPGCFLVSFMEHATRDADGQRWTRFYDYSAGGYTGWKVVETHCTIVFGIPFFCR